MSSRLPKRSPFELKYVAELEEPYILPVSVDGPTQDSQAILIAEQFLQLIGFREQDHVSLAENFSHQDVAFDELMVEIGLCEQMLTLNVFQSFSVAV